MRWKKRKAESKAWVSPHPWCAQGPALPALRRARREKVQGDVHVWGEKGKRRWWWLCPKGWNKPQRLLRRHVGGWGPWETAFWRRAQAVRTPLVNNLSCLMDSLALINICLWHYLQFTRLFATFCLPSVVNHLPVPWVPWGAQQDGGSRGMGTRRLNSREM